MSLESALQARRGHLDTQLILSAPASLLLCGEYFVTRTGGQGLCLAIEPNATCTITWHEQKTDAANTHMQDGLRLITRFAHQEYVFENACENEMYMLCEKYKEPYMRMYHSHAMPETQRISIHVDTNAFYTEVYNNKKNVRKRGLGSSEIAALLMCASLALCNGKNPLTNRRALASHASHAHYVWQGGRGSGYGAWTSAFGGMGIYTNYAEKNKDAYTDASVSTPFVQNLWNTLPSEVSSSLRWWFWNCGFAQSSQDALLHYHSWKRKNPHEEQKFATQYTQIFRALERDVLHARKDGNYAESVVQAIDRAKALGLSLGARIGVSADSKKCKAVEDMMRTYKAVGAGCECAVGVSYDDERNDDVVSDIQSVTVAKGIHYVVPTKRF